MIENIAKSPLGYFSVFHSELSEPGHALAVVGLQRANSVHPFLQADCTDARFQLIL